MTNTYGSSSSKSPAWGTLAAAYATNGGAVSVRLVRVAECTLEQETMCTIEGSGGCDACLFAGGMAFSAYTYFVEVTLIRTATTQTPKVSMVSVY